MQYFCINKLINFDKIYTLFTICYVDDDDNNIIYM